MPPNGYLYLFPKFRLGLVYRILLGLYSKLSRRNTPRNPGNLSFFAAFIISKFDNGLLGNKILSTEITLFNLFLF